MWEIKVMFNDIVLFTFTASDSDEADVRYENLTQVLDGMDSNPGLYINLPVRAI